MQVPLVEQALHRSTAGTGARRCAWAGGSIHGWAAMLAACLLAGCESVEPVALTPSFSGEPIIRVRINRQTGRVDIGGPPRVQMRIVGREQSPLILSTPLTVTLGSGRWQIGGTVRQELGRAQLHIETVGTRMLTVNKQQYPGAIRLMARVDAAAGRRLDRFDVVNYVPIESYLPGVLAKELYPDWHLATYHAQAIAARSYAINKMITEGRYRRYDVESTQASQVYGGHTRHHFALLATRDTAGLVLAYGGRIVPAYYSSCCGGSPQSASDAFDEVPIAPLEAQPRTAWCSSAKHFNWGPVVRNRQQLTRRIAAWGKVKRHPAGRLRQIRTIRVKAFNAAKRPIRFMISDADDNDVAISAENLRFACNFSSKRYNLPAPAKSKIVKSSNFTVKVGGDKVIFSGGHGFGHGVGMCQFGAQGMARSGHDARRILATFYPGARIDRAY